MMESVMIVLGKFLTALPYFGVLFLGLVGYKTLLNRTTSYDFDRELTEKDNPAFGAMLALSLIGVAIALSGAMYGSGDPTLVGFLGVVFYSILVVILMRISVWVNDKFILYKFSIHKEMTEKKCLGTAFVVGGSVVATGLVLNGALTGESAGFFRGVFDLCVYWFAGQVVLVIAGSVLQTITPYDVHEEIGEKDNVACGILFGGFLIGMGVIIRAGIAGSTSDLGHNLVIAAFVSIAGLIMLYLARAIADKVLLPKSPLAHEIKNDQNAGAGAMAAAAFIGIAIVFAAALTAEAPDVVEEVVEEVAEEVAEEAPAIVETITPPPIVVPSKVPVDIPVVDTPATEVPVTTTPEATQ